MESMRHRVNLLTRKIESMKDINLKVVTTYDEKFMAIITNSKDDSPLKLEMFTDEFFVRFGIGSELMLSVQGDYDVDVLASVISAVMAETYSEFIYMDAQGSLAFGVSLKSDLVDFESPDKVIKLWRSDRQ